MKVKILHTYFIKEWNYWKCDVLNDFFLNLKNRLIVGLSSFYLAAGVWASSSSLQSSGIPRSAPTTATWSWMIRSRRASISKRITKFDIWLHFSGRLIWHNQWKFVSRDSQRAIVQMLTVNVCNLFIRFLFIRSRHFDPLYSIRQFTTFVYEFQNWRDNLRSYSNFVSYWISIFIY